MAKNTSNTSYRKLDVDAFDPEKYDETEEFTDNVGIAGPDERVVQQFLQSGKHTEALKAALTNPPLNSKNKAITEKAVSTVVKVLTTVRSPDIAASLKSLDDDEIDILMKYIYKGMELMAEGGTCNSLLSWHSQTFARSGHGSIMRVISDRSHL
uniref:Actin-related protein 2/3 complex subunit 5 n=1 Tax=Rhabditophanes sp. KR3021 TaxID=114890 RepID=A0AC35TMM0_9BILA